MFGDLLEVLISFLVHILRWQWDKLDWNLPSPNENRSVLNDMGLGDDVVKEGRCFGVV